MEGLDPKLFAALTEYEKRVVRSATIAEVGWDNHVAAMKAVVAALEPKEPLDAKIFRWCYAAVVALAKRNLQQMNDELDPEDPKVWPAHQEWDDLAGSSKSIFLHKAREEAGIPDDEFLAIVRSGNVDVDDLYGR